MSSVKIVWATPEIDKVLGYITRVSNPANGAKIQSFDTDAVL